MIFSTKMNNIQIFYVKFLSTAFLKFSTEIISHANQSGLKLHEIIFSSISRMIIYVI